MIAVFVDKELDAAIYTIKGDVKYGEIRDEIDKYFKGAFTKYTVWDFSKSNPDKNMTADEIKQLGSYVSESAKGHQHRFDLIVVPNIEQYGDARMYQAYSETTPKETRNYNSIVFREMEEAIEFIRNNEKSAKDIK